jgi:hypothetical protein
MDISTLALRFHYGSSSLFINFALLSFLKNEKTIDHIGVGCIFKLICCVGTVPDVQNGIKEQSGVQ